MKYNVCEGKGNKMKVQGALEELYRYFGLTEG